ncbi:MAG: DUF5668 domain-containing protein [Chloroflexota bacterium]
MRQGCGVLLLGVGTLLLLSNFNVFWWLRWQYLWPVILIAIGLTIIFGNRRR